METKFSTSFIPKTNIDPVRGPVKKPLGLFAFLSTIIFFISAVVGAGAFGWHKYLEGRKATMKADLERNIKAFEPKTIDQYVRLDNRIISAKELLSKHVAVSYIFDFLQDKTLRSVGFTDFKYTVAADGGATLAMNGLAKSYNAIAFQSTVFGEERALKTPLFSNLDLDNQGDVVFNFSTGVEAGFIAYTRKASGSKAERQDLPSEDVTFSTDVLPVSATSSEAAKPTVSTSTGAGATAAPKPATVKKPAASITPPTE